MIDSLLRISGFLLLLCAIPALALAEHKRETASRRAIRYAALVLCGSMLSAAVAIASVAVGALATAGVAAAASVAFALASARRQVSSGPRRLAQRRELRDKLRELRRQLNLQRRH